MGNKKHRAAWGPSGSSSRAVLAPSRAKLGLSWGSPGALLGLLGRSWGPLGALLGPSGGGLGDVLVGTLQKRSFLEQICLLLREKQRRVTPPPGPPARFSYHTRTPQASAVWGTKIIGPSWGPRGARRELSIRGRIIGSCEMWSISGFVDATAVQSSATAVDPLSNPRI